MGSGGQKAQTSIYKMNKSWRHNIQHDDYSLKYHDIYLKVAKRVDLKSFHHKKKICKYVW